MKYEYRAKVNGIWYEAGEEIPEPAKEAVETVEKPVGKTEDSGKTEAKKPKKA